MNLYFTDPQSIAGRLEDELSEGTRQLIAACHRVPFFLAGDGTYLSDINDWLRGLPATGAVAAATWEAYAYDVLKWLRYLARRGREGVWAAQTEDYAAYYREYGQASASNPVSVSTWNRSNAALESLYRFGVENGFVEAPPFIYRSGRNFFGEPSRVNATTRTVATEPVKFLTREEFDVFLREGLRVEGDSAPRNSTTARLYRALVWLLVSTALRINEALLVMAATPAVTDGRGGELRLPAHLRKRGSRSVTVHVVPRIADMIRHYVRIERAGFVERGAPDFSISDPIYVQRDELPDSYRFTSTGSVRHERNITRHERARMIIVDRRGRPLEPALLFLNRDGRPLYGGSAVSKRFERANKSLHKAGYNFAVSPHDLRHTYAVHRLQQLTLEAAQRSGAEGPKFGSAVWMDIAATEPLRMLQEELGHSAFTATLKYLRIGRSPTQFSWAVE